MEFQLCIEYGSFSAFRLDKIKLNANHLLR